MTEPRPDDFLPDSIWAAEQRRLHLPDRVVAEVRSRHHLVVDDNPEHYVVPVVRCVSCRLTLDTPEDGAVRRHVAHALKAATAPSVARGATNTPSGGWDARDSQTRWEPSSKEAS